MNRVSFSDANTIKESITKNKTPDILSDKSKDLFDELFGDK